MTSFYEYRIYNIDEMVIYVDVVFLENLILDFIILLATGIICNYKFKILRLFLASIFGSIITVLSFITNSDGQSIKAILAFVIILIGFGFKSKKSFFRYMCVFYLTTITFGGASFMFLFGISPKNIIYGKGHFLGLYPVKMALLRRNIWFLFNCGSSKIVKKKEC